MTIRVILHQQALAKYRVPVFRELAARAGIDLTVIHGRDVMIDSVPPDGFKTEPSPIVRTRVGLYIDRAVLRSARSGRADVLVIPWLAWNIGLLPALQAARRQGVGTVVWGHGFSKMENPLRGWFRRRVGRGADAWLLYNETGAERLRTGFGFPPHRVFTARNALDVREAAQAGKAWRKDPHGLASFRARHGLGDGPVLLFVSRLLEENRADLLLRAAATLRPKFPGLRVAIIGKGPAGDGLRSLSESLGLGDTLVMPGAIYDESELAPWFVASRAMVYPNNMGLTILHAFAYGLPVITGDRNELHGPEIDALVHERNGLRFPHNDLATLTNTIERVLRDDDLHGRLADAAAWTVDPANPDGFSVERMVDGMVAAIECAHERARHRRAGGSSS